MKLIPNGMSTGISRQVLVAKKNSPHIFFVAGVVGVVTSAVLACRATLKLEDAIDEIKDEVDKVKEGHTQPDGRVYVTGDQVAQYRKDMGRVYVKGAVQVTKLYGPSVVLGAASIGCLTGSHVQLTRRNSALTATVALMTQAYDDYRDRVRELVGEDKERDLHLGVTTEKQKIDGKNEEIKIFDDGSGSPYSFWFNKDTSWNWQNHAYHNQTFLEAQQRFANDRLISQGYLFLNDVLHDLGMEKTKYGQILGWVYKRDGNPDGDNYVDFGIFRSEKNVQFIDGAEADVFLDFNVDGNVWNKI